MVTSIFTRSNSQLDQISKSLPVASSIAPSPEQNEFDSAYLLRNVEFCGKNLKHFVSGHVLQ